MFIFYILDGLVKLYKNEGIRGYYRVINTIYYLISIHAQTCTFNTNKRMHTLTVFMIFINNC